MYNRVDILEGIREPFPISNINNDNFLNTNNDNFETSSYNKTFDNSFKLRILFNSLCRICNDRKTWTFDIELISYKNVKSQFISNLYKLRLYILSSIDEEDANGFISDNYIIFKPLIYYLLHLLCEADLLSITKNYSNKIISTIQTIPNNENLVYSYIIDLCLHNNYIKLYRYTSERELERDIKIRFCNIYTILSQNLINKFNKEKIKNLLNSLIRLLFTDFASLYNAVDLNTDFYNTNVVHKLNFNYNINSFEAIKCINILLYNKLIKYYEIDKLLIDMLLEYLLYVLCNESRDYKLLSSCSTCFIGVLFFIIYKNDEFSIIDLIIKSFLHLNSTDSDVSNDVKNLIDKVRTFPKLNYIYTIRSIVLFFHNRHNYGIKNIFSNDELTNLLLKCYEIIRSNLLNTNIYIINYSLMQTVQTYTIFLTHNYKDLIIDSPIIQDTLNRDRFNDDFGSSNNEFDVSSISNKDRYIDSLIDLSNILINYFTNRIKTINNLSVYIYKKLVPLLLSMYKLSNVKNCCIDIEKEVNNGKKHLLINNVLDSMKKNRFVKAKYILLDTIIKHIGLEQLLENEPYLLLHLLVNINNNKSTITSLLVHIITLIQSYFKSLCLDNSSNSSDVSNFDGCLLSNRYQSPSELGHIVFKCYLYPILICMINDYKIVNDGVPLVDNSSKSSDISNFDGCLLPINTDPVINDNELSEVVRERFNCFSSLLTNLTPNFTFELLKLSNEYYRFSYFEFLPQSYKSILSEKVLDLKNFYTNLRQFNNEVVRNIFNKDLISDYYYKNNENKTNTFKNLDLNSSSDSKSIFIDTEKHFNTIKLINIEETTEKDLTTGDGKQEENKQKQNNKCYVKLGKIKINEQEQDKLKEDEYYKKLSENNNNSQIDNNNRRMAIDDRDGLLKILLNSKIVELKGVINYCESVCLYNFRKLNKLNFVNIQLEDKCYDGLMICNEFIDNRKNNINKLNGFNNEVYFIDNRRYMWNLYYSDNIETILNLIRTICDSKKISMLITSNEFLLIKFILKDVITFINLSNQHYFIQLIQLFLQRLHYNFTTSYTNYVKDFLAGSDKQIDGSILSNDNSFVDQKIGNIFSFKEGNCNNQDSSLSWFYLVANLKDIVEILGNNIEIWNNEVRILISLNILISISEMFLIKDTFSNDLSDQLKMFDTVMIERLFKLFYNLKPINHVLLSRIFRFVKVPLINSLVKQELDELIKFLFHFNSNKYQLSSNLFTLTLLNLTGDTVFNVKFLDCIESYFIKQFNTQSQNRLNEFDYSNSVDKNFDTSAYTFNLDHINLNNCFNKTSNSEKHNTRINNSLLVLNRLYKIILDYYNNIDEYLVKNVSVSGVINLVSNFLKNILDDISICQNELNIIYKLFLDMITHIISNYMSPNSENEGVVDGKDDRKVDCRGYYINNDLLRETYGGGKNELKLFNYVVYKLIHELIKATETIVFIFTKSLDVMSFGGINIQEHTQNDSISDVLDALIRTLIYCIINCRHVGCNDMFNNLLQFSMQKLLIIYNDHQILYRYIYMLINMIIYNPNRNTNDSIYSKEETNIYSDVENKNSFDYRNDNLLLEVGRKPIRNNVIDINTRSEHLSLIFISIIKAEGNKKLSILNNNIVFILIYILNILDRIECRNRSNDVIENSHELNNVSNDEVEVLLKQDMDTMLEIGSKFGIQDEDVQICLEYTGFNNDQDGIIDMINNCYINCNSFQSFIDDQEHNNYTKSTKSKSKMTMDNKIDVNKHSRENEGNLITINVLNILRYIYRCIDIKYMNVENVVDVIKVSLRCLDNNNWSVKNSSSLLLSTILSSLSGKPYFLNSFSNRTDGCGLLNIIRIVKDDNMSVEFYYYTLYLLKVIIESVDVVCKEQILLDEDQLNGLKWLLVSNNFCLRRIASIVLSSYYLHIGIDSQELLSIKDELLSHLDNNNYLNGYLLLLKSFLISTNCCNNSTPCYTNGSNKINSETKKPIKHLIDTLYYIYKQVNSIENRLLVLEIIKLIDCCSHNDNNFPKISDSHKNNDSDSTLTGLIEYLDVLSLYRYQKCKLMGFSKLSYTKILEEEFKNIETVSNKSMNDKVNIYLIMKCIERLIENNDIDIKMLNTVYKLICIYKKYTLLFSYYFITHNWLLEQYLSPLYNKDNISQDYIDKSKIYKSISLLFSKEYFIVVKYCINNDLTSNSDIYVHMFKSLLYYLLTIIQFNDLITHLNYHSDNNKDLIIGIDLLRSLNYMLLNNIKSDLDCSIRIKISNIYLESFELITVIKNFNLNIKAFDPLNGSIVDKEYKNEKFVSHFIQLLYNNLGLVFVNIMNLLHDDSSSVRYNIKKLIKFYIIDVYNPIHNLNSDVDYPFNPSIPSHPGYELEFLNYIVKIFNNNINIIINILGSMLFHKLTEINNSIVANNKEDTNYNIYSKEETNIYKEDILLIRNNLLTIKNLMLNDDNKDQIISFLYRLVNCLTVENNNTLTNTDPKSINKDKYTMIYTYTLSELTRMYNNSTII